MKIYPSALLDKQLDTFLSEKTITDVDRTKYIPFVYKDTTNKLTTCLMFNCNGHNYEDPIILGCEYTGAVIHLPAFWVEVPKELAFNYIRKLIIGLYEEQYSQWYEAGLIGDIPNSDNNSNNACCPLINNWTKV